MPGVRFLAMGGVDLQRDLNTSGGNLQTLYARSHLVLASRAAGIEPPIDSVFPLLDDDDGLRDQAQFARSLGFFGKSAIHPRQLEILHEVFTPTAAEIDWAQSVLAGFEAAGGGGFALPSGRVRRPARRRPGPPAAGDRGVSGDGRRTFGARPDGVTTAAGVAYGARRWSSSAASGGGRAVAAGRAVGGDRAGHAGDQRAARPCWPCRPRRCSAGWSPE